TQWLDRAIQTMEEVVSRERTAEHLLALGEMRSERGHAKAAEDTLREALALDEKNGAVRASLAQAIMQRARGEDIDVDEEVQHDHEAHEPRDPSEVSETVRAAAHEALPLLRQAAELDPTLPMIYTRIGTLYDLLGMPDDARIAYNDAITRDPADAGAHYALGTLQLQQQKPAAAIPHLERAVELSPFALAVRVSLASAYVAAGRKQEARRELDFADRLSPGLPEVAELRARLARVN
ncbi:MAG TPA: tetratricopeptide repeat protein, partial [Ktedonobacterales bacterium]